MDSDDDLKFRIIFSGDGAGKLRERVADKLKEFMGAYTDDTLVLLCVVDRRKLLTIGTVGHNLIKHFPFQEYVIVLLKNGRRKEEARNELNVFLGDDSDSFVSWLWDHLRSNIDLYTQSKESRPEVAKQKPKESHLDEVANHKPKDSFLNLHNESERIKSDKFSKSRRSKDWKDTLRDPDEPPPLRSAVIANIHADEKSYMRRSPSPQPVIQRKRDRSAEGGHYERGQPDERSQVKREAVSKSTLGASRRLLQSAVRDAVATSRPSSLTSEPSFKRLRSVVSTSIEDSLLEERRPQIRSVARAPAMAVAIKAVADAAKEAVKVKTSGNVFDRLGRSADIPDTTDHFTEDDGEYEGFVQVTEATAPTYTEQYDEDIPMLEHDAAIASDFGYGDEGYNNMNAQLGRSGGRLGNDSVMLHYNAANVVNRTFNKPQRDQNTPLSMANSSHNFVNTSSNINTWKSRGGSDMDNQKFVQETELSGGNYGPRVIKDNNNLVTANNGNGVPTIHAQRDIQKTLPSAVIILYYSVGVNSTGLPIDDADSRTIFVSNVHFAATKDSLSRHFNKFGDVLKVVIVTEAATGQPKGSAYVEFMRTEAAENALSLDGTSFMSRILKVVRKSSAQQEAAPVTTSWPRAIRASPFAASRFGRVPFPRGIPSPYRPRLPIKPGARSFQWKRDTQNTSSGTISSPVAISSPTTRSLTYVRTETKTEGTSNNA
ncbi:Nucleotide-binding, alpha-beta plait [Artemisia annua]|uniref:Nucleotide-binding, alpha-beta plait n=1 Tax=Artemisia annua TaxID=35608 RepID=A0A2U1KW77_ARTAN|nr:Nucleotide-binding, alpha-beta plait [Artemisia annua]